MPAYAWASLAVLIVAAAGGAAVAVASGLDSWRIFRSAQRRFEHDLDGLLAALAGMERRLDRVSRSTARLESARGELQESIAVARVIAASAGDVRTALRVLGIVRR